MDRDLYGRIEPLFRRHDQGIFLLMKILGIFFTSRGGSKKKRLKGMGGVVNMFGQRVWLEITIKTSNPKNVLQLNVVLGITWHTLLIHF